MPFLTFVTYGSLLVLAGYSVLHLTTRLALALTPEEALPYQIVQFLRWVRDGKNARQAKPKHTKKQDKVQVWSAIAIGVGITLYFTLRLMFSEFFHLPWHYLGELSTVLFIVLILILVKSKKHRVLIGICMVGTTLALEIAPSWLTINLAVIVGVFTSYIVYSARTSFVRAAIVLWVVAWLFDAIQVWGTQNIQAKVKRSVQLGNPDNLMIPTSLDLSAPTFMTLGFGDLFLPGLLVIVAGRVGQRIGSRQLYRAALLGYGIGLVAAMLVAYLFTASQPGLVYIVPAITLVTYIAAWRMQALEELKIKISSSRDKVINQ